MESILPSDLGGVRGEDLWDVSDVLDVVSEAACKGKWK